ncbi:MAG: hypothetical protein KGY45_02970 [Hadesarchaea archaeon]|nr:hypothetical protein [Hadesarchaea archaeon]
MRSTAYKVKIKDLVNGHYVNSPEGEPNYLVTPWDEQVLRVNLISTIIDKFVRDDGTYATITIDDGSSTIRAKAWEEGVEELEEFNVGDLVKIIGKVREYEGEIHLVPEIIREVEDPNWELVNELEILNRRKGLLEKGIIPEKTEEEKEEAGEGEEVSASTIEVEEVGVVEKLGEETTSEFSAEEREKALLAIEKMEGEEGATIEDLAAELDTSTSEAEKLMGELLNNDEIYEPQAGKFKILK